MKSANNTDTLDCGLRRNDGNRQIPTPSLERWKYSNLPAYVSGDYQFIPLSVAYQGDKSWLSSMPQSIQPWGEETYGDMALWSGLQAVLSVNIPEGNHVDKPVYISIRNEKNDKSEGFVAIHLHKNAKAVLYDDVATDGWCNKVVTITLEEEASLTHIRTGSGKGVVTGLTQIDLAAGATYNGYALNNFGTFVRDQIHARLNGEKAECFLSGAKILQGVQHCDTTITIDHLAPNCHSNQNYRNILSGQSRGVFQGKVYVSQISQKTDGYQLCNSILLSDKAEMDTKPELEIYADDVKCSHGATTAALDEDPLFYMMARGIPEDQARALLIQAFLNESLDALAGHEVIQGYIEEKISGFLDD